MKIMKNKIIDERQEKLSLQNTGIVFNVMIIMLLVMVMIQTFILQRGFSYVGPENITLLTGCILKIILDVRQGIVYTQMNAKTKLTALIYILAALAVAVLVGIRNYVLYDFALWKIVFVIVPIFVEMLILFAVAHFTCLKLSKQRLKKLEKNLDRDEFEE